MDTGGGGDLWDRDTPRVLAFFLLYSAAMFTMPFVAFFGTRHFLADVLRVEGFALTAWSVLAAVLTVNAVILAYAYRGYQEDIVDRSPGRRRTDPKDD